LKRGEKLASRHDRFMPYKWTPVHIARAAGSEQEPKWRLWENKK